ncbi:GNAT family N-acetyltransferase [Luteipulveratus halotolerans]|uniref:GNAT family N-acetyltransferase n=1 Tax=Luteipulveratus halotolerans TaxID=1631356 RepID=UPI00068334C9|nr:GNAT family N-acetyltransferase [Luteipulveratus halotolerans]
MRAPTFPDVVPTLTDGPVTLRDHRPADVERLVEQVNDPRSQRWTTVPMPYDASHARGFLQVIRSDWEDGAGRWWAVEVDGQFAGTINYQVTGAGVGDIGFGLHPDVRGRGIAGRSARLIIDWAFAHDAVDVMVWRAMVGNLASWRVAWANGFRRDGMQRQSLVNGLGERGDAWTGSLHRDEPRTPRHPWWEAAVLEGDRVRLRPWREDDAPSVVPDEVAERFNEGMQPTPEGFTAWREQRLERMSVGQGVFWCIADATTDEPLGGIQVQHLDRDFTRGSGTIGYWLHTHARGRGAVQDALALLAPHAFADRTDDAGLSGLGLHRLWAGTDEGNRASQRALRRAGFRQASTEREVIAHDDRPASGAISFELLASDDRVAQTIEPAVVPVLETTRLRLRPWRPDDRPRPEQDLDRDSLRFMPAGAQPDAATYDAWYERGERMRDLGAVVKWCIADEATDAPLGALMLFEIGAGAPGNAEIGYWLYADARGAGVLQEAIPAVLEHAFAPVAEEGLGLHRLHAATDAENVASQKLLEHNGFQRWGADHQAFARADGSLADGTFFELLADSWRAQQDDAPSPGLDVAVVDGERVRLRPWRDADAPRIVEACSDPVTRHWLSGLPDPYTPESAHGYVQMMRDKARAGATVGWCISDPATDIAIGAISLMGLDGLDPTSAEIGYWVHPDVRGRGVVTEATTLAVRHAFVAVEDGGLGLRRLTLNVAEGNEASAAVPRRLGFAHVGTDRRAEPLGDGSYVGLLRFDLLADDGDG